MQEIETHSGKDKDDKDKRHRKGPKRQNLEDLPAENRGNILRCRKYRLAKKEKEFNYNTNYYFPPLSSPLLSFPLLSWPRCASSHVFQFSY